MDLETLEIEKEFANKEIKKNSFKISSKIKCKPKKILIMGLPGTGKTTLAKKLLKYLPIVHLNADEIRGHFNDWDFSNSGRLRQAERMKRLSDIIVSQKIFAVTDFVCPLVKTRKIVKPDIIIWMDTEKKSRFEDTNKIFQEPKKFHFRVTSKNAKYWSNYIKERIINNDY